VKKMNIDDKDCLVIFDDKGYGYILDEKALIKLLETGEYVFKTKVDMSEFLRLENKMIALKVINDVEKILKRGIR